MVAETSDFETVVAATEKVVRKRACPRCLAMAGTRCGGDDQPIFTTHPERFPEGITPEEYLAS